VFKKGGESHGGGRLVIKARAAPGNCQRPAYGLIEVDAGGPEQNGVAGNRDGTPDSTTCPKKDWGGTPRKTRNWAATTRAPRGGARETAAITEWFVKKNEKRKEPDWFRNVLDKGPSDGDW